MSLNHRMNQAHSSYQVFFIGDTHKLSKDDI